MHASAAPSRPLAPGAAHQRGQRDKCWDREAPAGLSARRERAAPALPAASAPPPPRPSGFTRSALHLCLGGFNYMKRQTKPDEPPFPRLFLFEGREGEVKHRRTGALCPAHSSPIGRLCITYYRDPDRQGRTHLETHIATSNRLRGCRERRQRYAEQGGPADPVRGADTSARHTPSAGFAG